MDTKRESRRSTGRSRKLAAIQLLMFAAFAQAGCTLLVEPSTVQCKSDADCTRRGGAFADTRCGPQRICIALNTDATCTTHQDCLAAHDDEPYLCRKSDHTCVKLTSPECPGYLADKSDLADDDAIVIGTILDRSGTAAPIAKAMEAAFDLARADFKTATPGLPPADEQGERRPLVLVNCDEATDPVKAAIHLVDDLHVPAILGGFYSSTTIKVASTVTLEKNVLLITPASTSPLVTGLSSEKPRMVWRMVPNDSIQGTVVPQVISTLEQQIRADPSFAGDIKVALVHRGDAAGRSIGGVVRDGLRFNGRSAADNATMNLFAEYDYGDPLDKINNPSPEQKYADAAAAMTAFEPHVVITAGSTAEVVTKIMAPLEDGWANSQYRPRYLLANSNFQSKAVLDLANERGEEFRKRILGHVAQTTSQAFDSLKIRYQSIVTNPTFVPLVPFAYDAIYLLAYGIVAAGPTLSGPAIAKGFDKLLPPGPSIDASVNTIPQAYAALASGSSFDLNGASGPLDFDPRTGDAPCDIQVWCIATDESHQAVGFVNSGYYYDAKANTMKGSISPTLCP